jgi:hypothetical protein
MPTRTLDISKALAIDGWMTEKELCWLGEQAQGHSRIVEYGSFLGRSTRALCDNTSGWVMAVDNWLGPRDADVPDRSNLLARFKSNLQGVPCELRIVKGDHDSPKVKALAMAAHPDMVFLDGDHRPEAVFAQISFWCKSLEPGSLLCGHDAKFPPVTHAVINLLGTLTLAPDTEIWYARV